MENSYCIAEMMRRRKSVKEAVRTMSSTSRSRYVMSKPRRSTNKLVSDLDSTNLRDSRKAVNQLYPVF